LCLLSNVCFFFQPEDGIRDFHVTGVQTCALPISKKSIAIGWSRVESRGSKVESRESRVESRESRVESRKSRIESRESKVEGRRRAEERRVGKGRRARVVPNRGQRAKQAKPGEQRS